jgi:nucleotide-binding universal stress UspA family protein
MIKKILVPTDFSESSFNALEIAITIAANYNALLQILHINDIIPESEESNSIGNAQKIFDAMAGNIQIKHGIKTEIIFAEGIVGHVIVKTVFENKTDLIIMGSHGISGARELFIGSNAYYVIKRANCPVLLIPEGNKWHTFERILFPVQQSVFSLKLFEMFDHSILHNPGKCMVNIFGISSNKMDKNTLQFSSKVDEVKTKYHGSKTDIAMSVSKNRNIAENVLVKAVQMKADLIVITPGLDLTDKPFFIGPFAQRIINHSKTPILSILRTSNNL